MVKALIGLCLGTVMIRMLSVITISLLESTNGVLMVDARYSWHVLQRYLDLADDRAVEELIPSRQVFLNRSLYVLQSLFFCRTL